MKVRALIAALAAIAVLVAVLDRGQDQPDQREEASGDLLAGLRATVQLPEVELDPAPPETVPGKRYPLARVQAGDEVELHETPGGKVFALVGDRTEFGSVRTFWIARVRGEWLGVTAPELPNGKLGWIRDDRTLLDVLETRFWILADVSRQTLELHHGGRVLDRFTVTVGSPGSPTPVGEYSVTDGLVGEGVGPYYGCCVLALSGHQPNLPANWLGGDRIAIHGTPDAVGGARSAGCLRATDPDMVSLFARVPLGAPVFIRA